jgi:DNA (cytosine-5)-methyltransferase 1
MLMASGRERRFSLVAASDINKNAELTHTNRFQKQLGISYGFIQEDIRSAEFAANLRNLIAKRGSAVDVVVGGPPCQGFSLFGARQETDPRNDLFRHYLRAIDVLRPKYFVMENVPGLAMMYGGKTVDSIFEQVKKLTEYDISGPFTVNASRFGVPQNRERIIFVGNRRDMAKIDTMPQGDRSPISVREAIGDLSFLRPWESSEEYSQSHPATTPYQRASRKGRLHTALGAPSYSDGRLTNHQAAKHTPDVIARFAMMRPGFGLDSVPRELWDRHLSSSKKWCVRLDPDKPSFTVMTLPDDFVHYQQPRVLTVREMARLQSFDDTFQFLGPRSSGGGGRGNKKRNTELPQYSQVGNAVPPLMARAIGEKLLYVLDSQSRSTSEYALSSRLHLPVRECRPSASA